MPLAKSEDDQAFEQRRAAAGIDADLPACGLALSGGGVRSATFCLGLLRAFAANGVLKRFDYLSTVSGGGYAGAALGRLYRPGTSVGEVEAGLASDGSLWLWWLRTNGRYLLPAGTRDLLQTAASQLRGVLATQFEAAILALLIAALIVLPHVLIQSFGLPLSVRGWLQAGGTLWWAALPLPVLAAGVAIVAYWFSRDERDPSHGRDAVFAAAMLALALWLIAQMLDMEPANEHERVQVLALGVVVIFLLCVPIGYAAHLVFGSGTAAEDRIVHTGWLAGSIAAFGAILVFGLADLVSWLAAWLWLYGDDLKFPGGAGLALIALIIARAVLPMLEKLQRASGGGLPLARLANIAGLMLVALLALLWLTLLQAFVFLAEDGPAMQALLMDFASSAGARWGVVVTIVALYCLLTMKNLEQLNRSSLHEFYRSRLARTYVSVGNFAASQQPQRDPATRFPVSPLSSNERTLSETTEKITRLLPGDDVLLGDYRPHAAGGPIHIINCCINQTRDDRTGSYNADRKGIALAVSSLGLETGTHLPAATSTLAAMPLSRWIAISGAAASSGMGSFTRPGTSALLFLSGLRLGYWWRRAQDRYFGKYRAVLSEMLARFPGLRSPAWYLSDGGHFDNTGVYALLKRRLPLIVLADCGADPRYLFTDLENLVRKARLDYAAHIEFVDPAAVPDPAMRSLLGTPDNVGPEPGNAFLLLARIRYSDGRIGALLAVKPRRLPTLPLDIIGYADRDPHFPQQSTSDQFFDEAQWESYHALGKLLGAAVTPTLLENLPAWVANATLTDIGTVSHPAARSMPVAPATRRERMVTTVGTSLGVGAIASVLLASWQLWDEHNRLEAERQRAFLEASTRMADTMAASKGVFSPEVKIRLDALLALAGAPENAAAARRQTLQTLAETLEPICAQQAESEEKQCKSYLATLRGEKQQAGPFAQAMAQYWVDRSGVSAAPALAATPVTASTSAAAPARPPTTAPAPGPPKPAASAPAEHAPAPPTAAAPPVAPTPAPPPAQVSWSRAQCTPGTKTGLTLYIHIYDERERGAAMAIARRALDAGLAVPRIDNITASARQQAQAPPVRWNRTTWLYRGEDGLRCAEAARAWLASAEGLGLESQLVELPAALRAPPGVIELWLPSPSPSAK